MSREQSKKRGPRVELDKQGRPVFVEAVSPDVLRTLKPSNPDDVATVHEFLRVYGLEDAAELAAFERQYLARHGITPGQPRYEERLRQLAEESYSDRVAVAMGRRAAQKADTVAALDGNLRAECVYINDGPNPCPECEPLNGEMMTYAEFESGSMMPGDRCLGGDNCLCILQPVNT